MFGIVGALVVSAVATAVVQPVVEGKMEDAAAEKDHKRAMAEAKAEEEQQAKLYGDHNELTGLE